ncbi:MAG TPA: hypothetical protein PLD47_05230 [Aggregatilineales bacterium]|nr:hypothetical protein [Aggregatilineales bacterium]
MNEKSTTQAETTRLEALWQGDFGDAYVDRNIAASRVRPSGQ